VQEGAGTLPRIDTARRTLENEGIIGAPVRRKPLLAAAGAPFFTTARPD